MRGALSKSLSETGAGDIPNYGIRTMISVGNDLYLGSPNPMNLSREARKADGN